jgi:N-methylhydantoinase B
MTNTRNTPIESLEHAYPFRVLETRIRRGSGGQGRHRGGDGIVRTIEVLAGARVTVIADRRRRGPYGLAGGSDGAPGVNTVRVRGREETWPGKRTGDLPAGGSVTVASPGGGGFGKPGKSRKKRSRRGPRAGA